MLHIWVDADACPVKQEIYRVAQRYKLPVTLVANSSMRTPEGFRIELVVVPRTRSLDEADDWIAERVEPGDIVITADVPLAARAIAKDARAISPRGREFTKDSIGTDLATRDLLTELRESGEFGGGPPPFEKRDRSRFLQRLDAVVQAIRRTASRRSP